MSEQKRDKINRQFNRQALQKRMADRRKEQEERLDAIVNLERNAPANISTTFRFHRVKEYDCDQILFQDNPYFHEAIQLCSEWAAKNRWKSIPAQRRKDYLISVIANLLTLPRTSSSKIQEPLSIRVTADKIFTETILFLREKKYINYLPGYNHGKESAKLSIIYPTETFDTIFPPFADRDTTLHITIPDTELIKKTKDNKAVKLSSTDIRLTTGKINKLQRINQVNLSHKIVIKGKKHEIPCVSKLQIVYSETLKRGGRIYASGSSYQTSPQNLRALIFIDNEPTVELDYSGLHPRMLYAEKGIQFEGDLYDLSDVLPEYQSDQKLRVLSKLALLIVINAKDNKNIAGILPNHVWKEDIRFGRYILRQYQTPEEGAGIYKRVVEAVRQKHYPINEYFGSDSGARLQNKDGQMALWICDTFAKQGIPILPVHDSFIVAEQHETHLRDTMNTAYIKFNNGFSCPIDKKKKPEKEEIIIPISYG
jgi:hypothetical protein